MQRIAEIMTPGVRSIGPQDNVRQAAQLMQELNVGTLPVCEGPKLVGMLTDRDIVVRALPGGERPDAIQVGSIMSTGVQTCFDDQQVDEVLEQMGDSQLRRIPVLDRRDNSLIGIVSLGDMATMHSAGIDHTLANISTPSEPQRPAAG